MTTPLPIPQWTSNLDRARGLARAYAEAVRAHFNERVRRVLLYGSVVSGEWTPESDVDILILLDRVESSDMDWIVKQATKQGLIEEAILIQPLVLPESEFNRLKQQERRFALEVEKTGSPL